MRLSNHQKDATWDIWPVLVSRRPVPIDGEPRRVIFSLLWNWRSLSSQLRESFSLEEQKHISVWRTYWWYTQTSFPKKQSEALIIFWQTEPHVTGALATGTGRCYPCGVAVSGWHGWEWGFGASWASVQSCLPTSRVTWADHWMSWSLSLFIYER